MAGTQREFQIFAKPAGSACNLACSYCYYTGRETLQLKGGPPGMADDILEEYIRQHIDASAGPEVRFSWHGGEPTLLGLDYFRKIVALQAKHRQSGKKIMNGIQTNATLLDEDWCRFFAAEGFTAGVSLDGPAELHDRYRLTGSGGPSHVRAMRGYRLLRQHAVPCDILCVVHAGNVGRPVEVYRFFKEIGAGYIGFLPIVESATGGDGLGELAPSPDAFGDFLCAVFDEWLDNDVGRLRVQIFEEAIAAGLGREHALCVFRKTCGDIPVVEANGDFFCCDHFADVSHRVGNIMKTPLADLLESPGQRSFGQAKLHSLPRYCKSCEVLAMCNGGCPKDRILTAPDGEYGLNYLCAGYKHFFTHCGPFIAQVAALSETGHADGEGMPPAARPPVRGAAKPGRNDPCPCGSGRKYKKCCIGK